MNDDNLIPTSQRSKSEAREIGRKGGINSGKRTFAHPQFAAGTASNVIDVPPNTTNEYAKEHHATFPVALAGEIISNFTNKSILDLFGGTGTTMVVAEQLGRKCYMMELDPHYCDVIIARWEKLSGGTAVKIEDV